MVLKLCLMIKVARVTEIIILLTKFRIAGSDVQRERLGTQEAQAASPQ